MYKRSQFTQVIELAGKYVFYHSRSNAMAVTKEKELLSSMGILNKQEKVTVYTQEQMDLAKKLAQMGFLVEKDYDESMLSQLDLFCSRFSGDAEITILTTEQCNFRCKYCYEKFERGPLQQEIRDGLVKYIKKHLRDWKSLSIDWFGGEPLEALSVIDELSPQFIALCNQSGKAYSATMTTNGYLLNLETFKKLQKHRIKHFQITLDGPQSTHDNARVLADGSPTYQTIINNLRSIRDNVHSHTFSITIRTNVTTEVDDKIEEHLAVLHKEFGNDDRFSFYFRPVGDWGGDCVKTIKSSLVHSFSDFLDRVAAAPFGLNYSPYKNLLAQGSCAAVKKNEFVLGSDGTIYKCTVLFDNEDNHIGLLHPDGTMEINESKMAKWILPNEKSKACGSCFYQPKCGGSACPANQIVSKASYCGHEKRDLPRIFQLLLKTEKERGIRIFANLDEA